MIKIPNNYREYFMYFLEEKKTKSVPQKFLK